MAKLEIAVSVKYTIWYWIAMACVFIRWYKAFTIFSTKPVAKIYINGKLSKRVDLFQLKEKYES